MIVELTAPVEADPELICDHIARDSPVRAAGLVRELYHSCPNTAGRREAWPK
jgi:hypothetical protein